MTRRDMRMIEGMCAALARVLLSVPFLALAGLAAIVGIWRLG